MSHFTEIVSFDTFIEPLDIVVALLNARRQEDYYAYENNHTWHIGLGNYSSLVVGPDGRTATRSQKGSDSEHVPITAPLNETARAFVSEYAAHGKVFGQVGCNYSAHAAGQSYNPGKWPMLSLLVPRVQVSISSSSATTSSLEATEVKTVAKLIRHLAITKYAVPSSFFSIDLEANSSEYKDRVTRAIRLIRKGKFIKAIPSRLVHLNARVDMLATLYHARRANTPARTFTFSHSGYQATGLSPEMMLSIDNHVAYTEALAGTELADSGQTRSKLLTDPKEVMEHVMAIHGSIRRLRQFCHP